MLLTNRDIYLTQRRLIFLHIYCQRKYEKTLCSMFELVWTDSAANADNVSNTMTIATAGEALKKNIKKTKKWCKKEKTKNYLLSLVRSAVASAHVIPLVPGKKGWLWSKQLGPLKSDHISLQKMFLKKKTIWSLLGLSDISKFFKKKWFSVPDLSLAGGIGHRPVLTVPIMVVPLKIWMSYGNHTKSRT